MEVSLDQLNSKKNRYPEFNQDERLEMVKMIKGVNSVLLEEGTHLARLQLFRLKPRNLKFLATFHSVRRSR